MHTLRAAGLLVASTGVACGGSLSTPALGTPTLVLGCTLADDTTLRCSDADGMGQTVVWLRLSDGSTVAAAYTWPVRPGAVPTLTRAIHLHDGRAAPLSTDLAYVWPTLRGTLPLTSGPLTVDLDLSAAPRIQGTHTTDLTALLRGTALRVGS